MKVTEQKISKRDKILQHAAILFTEQGFAGSSMRELALRVGVEPSTLYSHISGKDELLREICFACAKRFTDGMLAILEQCSSPKKQLEALIDLHIDIAISDLSSITVFNDEWKHLDTEHLIEFKALRRDYEQKFTGILQSGVDAGEFRNMDVQIQMYSILSAIRWIHYWYKPSKAVKPQQIKQEIKGLILHGLIK